MFTNTTETKTVGLYEVLRKESPTIVSLGALGTVFWNRSSHSHVRGSVHVPIAVFEVNSRLPLWMRQLVTIHIGQAGCQIGSACWELFCLEVSRTLVSFQDLACVWVLCAEFFATWCIHFNYCECTGNNAYVLSWKCFWTVCTWSYWSVSWIMECITGSCVNTAHWNVNLCTCFWRATLAK